MLERLDAAITRERLRTYPLIILAFGVVSFLATTWLGRFPITAAGQIFLPDFLAHWTGGRMVIEGKLGELYDPGVQAALQGRHVPGNEGFSWFVGPPFYSLGYVALARLSYGSAALLWTVLTLSVLASAAVLSRPFFRSERQDGYRGALLVFAGSAAAFELVGSGQDSAMALLLWVVALRLFADGREGAAGLMMGLGLFKPQLFILVPVVLLVRAQYRALASFTGVAVAYASISVWLVGIDGVMTWLRVLGSPLYLNEVQEGQAWKMQSLSAILAWIGAPHWLAYLLLLLGTGLLVLLLRRRRDLDVVATWAVVSLTTVVFSPHVVSYDLVILLPALLYAFTAMPSAALRVLGATTFFLGWTEGTRHLAAEALGGPWALVGAPWTSLGIAGLWIVVFRHLLRQRSSSPIAIYED